MPRAEAGSTDVPGLHEDGNLTSCHPCSPWSKGLHQPYLAALQKRQQLQEAGWCTATCCCSRQKEPVLHAVLQRRQQLQEAEQTSLAFSCCAAGAPVAAGGRRLLTLPSELIEPDIIEEDPAHGDIAAFQARLGALLPHAQGRLSGAQSAEVSTLPCMC